MIIRKQGRTKRKIESRQFWFKVAKDYNNGMTPSEIARKYKNPITGLPYTRQHISLIIGKLMKSNAKNLKELIEQ